MHDRMKTPANAAATGDYNWSSNEELLSKALLKGDSVERILLKKLPATGGNFAERRQKNPNPPKGPKTKRKAKETKGRHDANFPPRHCLWIRY